MSVVIITINPSEMLKRTRDTRRISDLKTLNNAIQYFQASLPDDSLGTPNTVYVSIPDSSATCTNLGLPSLPTGWSYKCSTPDNYRKIDGNGWIPINFRQLDIGAPISALPIDPINSTSTGNYYTYVVGGSWELTAKVESSKYKKGGEVDKDGGKSSLVYEIGTDLNLLPAEVLGRGSTYEELTTQESALVGYWKFDEGSGTIAYDLSGNGNNGTIYGATWTQGKVGGALSFDGVDDYVDCGNSDNLRMGGSDFTVSLWFKLASIDLSQSLITKGRAFESPPYDNKGWAISFYNGNKHIYFDTYKAGLRQALISNKVFSLDGQWYYLTIVKSGTSAQLYLNGQLDKTGSAVDVVEDSVYNVFIGRNGIANDFINGLIDEVRIYNRALSDAEIKALYDATK